MQWDDFLTEVADTHLLSPEQKAAFLARLDDKNDKNGQSETKVASNLNISVAAFKKLMSEVYKKFALSCPELAASGSRGKLEKLRACLRAKYTERLTGTPTTFNGQVGKAHPTPNAPRLTLYENLGRKGVERDRFIGRDEKLKELHDLLQENAQVAITAAVIGMGGVGKTELAIQYAREYLTTYQGGICWLSANNFALKLVEFARPRFFPNVNFDAFSLAEQVAYCWQHWAEGDVLLVLDDVTNYRQQVQPYLPESSRFKVLVTTRERLGKPIVLLDLEVLAPADALELLKSFLGNERVEQELDVAAELCEWLGYLPLGLELVGRYLEEESLSIAQMLERLKHKGLRHPSLKETDTMMTAQRGVADAFELSWEHLDENAQQLGCLLSLFALAPILWALVEGVYKCWQSNEFEPENLEKSRRDLIKLHLLKTDKETYSLHQLIQEFFKQKLESFNQVDEMKGAFAATMVAVAKDIPEPRALTRQLIQLVAPTISHVAEVATSMTQFLSNGDLLKHFESLAGFYLGQGFYIEAESWCQKCIEAVENRFGSEHFDFAASLSNLGLVYKAQGRYSEAEPLYRQALSIDENSLPPNHRDLAISLNNLALLYKSQGHYSEAEPLYLKALSIDECSLPPDDAQLAQHRGNLANLYMSQGRYSEAEPLFRRALQIHKRTLPSNHPDLAISLNNLALLFYYQERYSEAESLYQQTLSIDEISLPPNHPALATHLNNLALLYTAQERYSEAESLYRQALSIDEISLPPNHPTLATHLHNLAHLYESQGRENEAESLYIRAFDILDKKLGTEATTTIKVRKKLEFFRAKRVGDL